jgi:S-formylglutathione hydrolase FrmB
MPAPLSTSITGEAPFQQFSNTRPDIPGDIIPAMVRPEITRSKAALAILLAVVSPLFLEAQGTKFEVSFPAALHAGAITGRVFLFVAKNALREPRLQSPAILLGADVRGMQPDQPVAIDGDGPGFPAQHVADLPAGDYYVQAVLNVYTEFHRSDGHTIWAHMDQWEGQDFIHSPGNLISEPQKVSLNSHGIDSHGSGSSFRIGLTRVIPPIAVPADTEWVKRIKFESKILSRFWGRPIYLGATILLPKDYNANPAERYPAIYLQGHFSLEAPFGFTTQPDREGSKSWAALRKEWAAQHLHNMPEPPPGSSYNGALMNVESGYEFYQAWNSADFPRMIAVTFQHPTPYFDDSYGVNSPNAGPYGDAIMNELIPAVEEQFRIIRRPYARMLAGGSTGGWGALAMQLYHPDFFGGTWSFYPDPVDLRRYYGGVDLYKDDNAFTEKPGRVFAGGGQNNRRISQQLALQGTQDGGFEWTKHTPVGPDGYPRKVWGFASGKIDREVVQFMKDHDYDLREFLERNWPKIGAKLEGKLHVYCGDEDGGFANLAVYLLEDFLEGTKGPYYAGSFEYGRPMKGHGWQPTTNAELVRAMAKYIAAHAPGR